MTESLLNQPTYKSGDRVTFTSIEDPEPDSIYAPCAYLAENPKFEIEFEKKYKIHKVFFDYIMEAWFYIIEREEKEKPETIMYKIFEKNNEFYHYIPQAYFEPSIIKMTRAEQV